MHVLILGAYGLFGWRLAQRLAAEPRLRLTLAGRSAPASQAAAARLRAIAVCEVAGHALDAATPDLADALRRLQVDVLIHAAGPFQGQDYAVARACLTARCHYIDLADSTDFVLGIGTLAAEAERAGRLVCSGASSVPALSCAAVTQLLPAGQRLESIDIGIVPGNRTPRGLATVAAVLSYCGRPLPRANGEADAEVGWLTSWSYRYDAPVGRRLLSPCDVPDRLLFPRHFADAPRVRFGAGLELRILHRALNGMAWLAHRGVVRDWVRYAPALRWLAEWLRPLGSDCGAMHVAIVCADHAGTRTRHEWQLIATHGDGPFVPTLAAAALVRRLLDGTLAAHGARPCLDLLTLQDFERAGAGLAISTRFSKAPAAPPIYCALMGAAFARLAAPVQRFHRLQGKVVLTGEVDIEGPRHFATKLLAWALGAPRRSQHGPLRFELDADAEREIWTRHFPTRTMRSVLCKTSRGLTEKLGMATLTFELRERDGILSMHLQRFHVLGLPMPRWLMPTVRAEESGQGDRFVFDVEAGMPLLGRVSRYRGFLMVP